MNDEEIMLLALKEAEEAKKEGEVPVGALILKNGTIIAKGHNEREKQLSISRHAEIVAMEKAAKKLGTWHLEGCTLYVTLEPCLMCAGAILQARIQQVIFGAKDPKDGALVSRYRVFDIPSLHERPLVNFGIKEEECSRLLTSYFQKKRKL